MSIAGSFLISHSIYLFIAVVQTFIFRKFSRAKFLTRIAAEDLIYILMFFSAVLSWKFYWDVVDNFILEEKMEFPLLLLGHGAAFTVALALKVSAILVGPGTSYLKDIEYIEPPQTYFQINYLSNIFKVNFFNLSSRFYFKFLASFGKRTRGKFRESTGLPRHNLNHKFNSNFVCILLFCE